MSGTSAEAGDEAGGGEGVARPVEEGADGAGEPGSGAGGGAAVDGAGAGGSCTGAAGRRRGGGIGTCSI